jgi:hypothetical protein
MPDYTEQIAELWPTIMQAWDEHGDKHPIIECDVVRRKVAAMPAKEYIDGLTERTREATRREFEEITAEGGMMVFIRDSKNCVLRSHVFTPGEIG